MKTIINLINKEITNWTGTKFEDLHDLLNTIKVNVYDQMTDEQDELFDIDIDYDECDDEVESTITITNLKTEEDEEIQLFIDIDNEEYSIR